MIDYHTHSYYSDGVNSYKDLALEAQHKGLQEIGFSDHFCLEYPKWAVKKSDFQHIVQDINSIKGNINNIKIKFGLETDYLEGKESEIQVFLNQFPLDYVIGSVHYINNWNFDTGKKTFSKINIDEFYIDYFKLIQKAAQSGLFDIIGHIDLAKKFAYYPSFDLSRLFEETASVLKKANVAYELNTSGMDKDCKEFYPSEQFIKILFDFDVPVTLGSDSHKTKDVARYFDLAINKLKNIGYKSLSVFTNRKRSFIEF